MKNTKFPKKLSFHLYCLISEGVKTHGSYDPNEILYIFEENLTSAEYNTVVPFLSWVSQDSKNRCFGSGNYESRYQEFLVYAKSDKK